MFKKIFINIVIFIFILSSIVVIGSCIINVNASTTLDSEVEYNEIEIINISEKEFEISFLIENDYQMLNLLDYNIYLIKEETNYKMVFNYYIVDFNSKINNGIIKSITFYEFDIRNDDYKSPYLEIVIYFNDSNSVKLYRCLVNELQFELILNNTKQTENDDINYERLINAVHFKRNYYLEQEVPISLLSKSISNEIGAIQYISLNDTDKWNDIISHYNGLMEALILI